jgi:tRNA 2-selenouridine synthase
MPINLELFSDEERAVVGNSAYKQESKERATEIGFEYVKLKLKMIFYH